MLKKIFFLLSVCFLLNTANAQEIQLNNYAMSENWISKPEKINHSADVFYLYPTTCKVEDLTRTEMCSIDDKKMRSGANRVFNIQAMAFDTVANIYAPYYSQLDANALIGYDYNQTQDKIKNNKQEMSDVYSALDYYFTHLNQGRPFILASHSQGSSVMLIILSDYMKRHPEYYKNMVAAYVVGFSVTKDYLKENKHLKFAKTKDDTGVIISYNTQSPNKSGPNLVHTKEQIAINPINWRRDEKIALKESNLGSLDERTLKITTPGIADAKVNKKEGVVECSSVDEKKYSIPMYDLFGTGSYHGQDYQFYFLNLRKNAQERIDSFLIK